MNDPVTISITTPHDLLTMAPLMLGFDPSDSFVALSLGRGLAVRVDLIDGDDLPGEAGKAVARALMRANVEQVALVGYTDNRDLFESAIDAFATATTIEICAVAMLDSAGVMHMRNGEWHTQPFVRNEELAAAMLAQKSVEVRKSREELAQTFASEHEIPTGTPYESPELAREVIDRAYVAETLLTEEQIGSLYATYADSPATFDHALIHSWESERPQLTLDVMGQLARHARGGMAAHLYTALAYMQWRSGDGASAWVCLDRAAEFPLDEDDEDDDITQSDLYRGLVLCLQMTMNPRTAPLLFEED